MDSTNHPFPWLELIGRPAFCVRDGSIIAINTDAESRMLRIGMDVLDILGDHREAYGAFEHGSLHMSLTIDGLPCAASITRTEECDIFVLHEQEEDTQLQALALAAQQLRAPLSNVMTVADRLLSELNGADTSHQVSQINRNLFQLLRIVCNMSDAAGYCGSCSGAMETVNLTAVLDEIVEKAQCAAENAGIKLAYTGLNIPVFGLANTEKLERAIYNLLSNAIKFSRQDSTVQISVSKSKNQLSLTVCNSGREMPHQIWQQYRRAPAVEDLRYGLGLGMTLIRAAAVAHKGSVLVDHPSEDQTRVTFSIAIVKDSGGTVRSPVMHIGDYTGGRDKGLVELADILPTDPYQNIN